LVAFADCELVAINNAMMLVINRHNGRQQIMSPQVVEGMKTCTEFKTIDAHAAHLASTRPELQGKQAMAANALGQLKTAGMLLEAADICTRLARAAPRQLPPTRVFVITCDRPAAVERLLDSMLQAGKLSQHNALFLVDDSRDPANRAANREAVAKFNRSSAREMLYVGEEAQHTLLTRLTASLPAHAEGIAFLLDRSRWQGRKTYGRSRTLCLLLSVDYRALVMDDDILCQAMLPPVSESGLGICSGGMRKASFYPDLQALRNSARPADFDPLSGHASLLGSNLGSALQSFNNGALVASQLGNTNAALLNVLRADSPILVTQCGSLGDTGTGGANWALYLGDDSVERMLQAPHGMRAALENRLNWLGSARPNFFKMPFMSQLTGLDNSHLLPPYFPVFRGEDSLFGAMLVAMHHHSMALEYPWSVPHLPLENRHSSIDAPIAATGGISLFARYLTERIDYKDTTDPQHNLNFIAQDALRIAARSDVDLLLDFRTELARGHADQLYLLQSQLARGRQFSSPQWEQYLTRGIEETQRALTIRQSPTAITGVPADATEAGLLAEFRGMARGFAAAMAGWVEMRTIAADLTDELVLSGNLLPR
jgi:hypothetical protein